ncbi:MAG: YCF48-related protein [Candidatus Sulfotelmatobacter sp.]
MTAAAQQASQKEKPKFKAIWEPVNYPYDAELRDVWFVSADEGWVVGQVNSDAGDGGVILHTKDGGQHWDAQLGDPHSATRVFESVFFLDAKHGWATEAGGGALLRTQDGETWDSVAQLGNPKTFTFSTQEVGFYLEGEKIYRSGDAGHTWKQVFTCRTKVEVEGLARDVECKFQSISFPSTKVGYATTSDLPNKASAIAKTEDGGVTWSISRFLPNATAIDRALLFTDENSGYIRTYGGKLFATADGGQTWRGIPQSAPAGQIRFADRQVGWVVRDKTVMYTSDGGKRWNAAEVRFPADVFSSSFPARDRGYVVGDHGMIYRYRIVPIAYTVKGMLPAAWIAPQ